MKRLLIIYLAILFCSFLSAGTKTITLHYDKHDFEFKQQSDGSTIILTNEDSFNYSNPVGAPCLPMNSIMISVPGGF